MTEQEKMYVSLRNEYNELDVQASGYRSQISELEAENSQLKSEIVSLKERQTLDIRAEFGIIESRLSELEQLIRYNPYHDKEGKFTFAPSGQGVNEFRVKGFYSTQKLNNHWKDHASQYLADGIVTKEQYLQRALDIAQSACNNRILGYRNNLGQICRYDSLTNDYVKGNPNKGIITMFKPDGGMTYFYEMKEFEAIED